MPPANLGQGLGEGFIVEPMDGVGTEEHESVGPSEVVPEFFQPNRRMVVPRRQEDAHYFTEDSRGALASGHASDEVSHGPGEAHGIRGSPHHELRQRVGGIQKDVLADGGRGHIDPGCGQPLLEAVTVLRCGDDDARVAGQ